MKRKLAWLILLSMLLSFTASMEELKLPEGVTRIEEEAFMGDRSVTSIKLNDHIQAIGPRAFWNCEALQEIYIPDSVTQIGEQAFYKNAMITCGLESYAYDYARQNGYRVNVVGNYVIHKVWMDGDDIQATVSTTCACTLQVEMLDEEKTQTLYTASTALPRNAQQKQVSFQKTNAPDSFVLRASLLDKNGYNITYPYESMDYTSAYKTFENRTPEDFPEEQVLNYGSAGFGVLDDSVINVTGSREGNRYRIISDVALHVGDAIYIQNLNELVKIGAFSKNADGSYAVTPEEKADLTDCYQYLRYSDTIDAVNALAENGTIPRSAVLTPRGDKDDKKFTKKIEKGEFSADCSMGVSVHCDIKMDRILFPDGYIDVETYGMVSGSINYKLSSEASFEASIPVFDGYIPTSVPGVFVNVDVSVPIKFKAEGKIEFDTSFEMKGGVKYSTKNGVSPIKEGGLSQKLSAEAKISGSAGARLGLDLMYMNILSIGAGATVGASIEAVASKTFSTSDSPETVEKKHACALCFDINIDAFVDLDANIALQMLGERDTVSKTWPAARRPIFKGYLSVKNDKNSIHGGKIVLNAGECPNYSYRTKYQVYNEDGKERAKNVTINRIDPETLELSKVDSGISKYFSYLSPGAYEAETYFEGYYNPDWVNGETVKERFVIVDAPKDVELRRALKPTPKPTTAPTIAPTIKPTCAPIPETPDLPGIGPAYTNGKVPLTAAYFPDAKLRDYLKMSDDDGDGYLSLDERNKLTDITVSECSSIQGLEYFPNIKRIDLIDATITDLCLRGFDKLSGIWVHHDAPLEHIDVKGCAALNWLNVYGTNIKRLDVSGMENLEYLGCSENPKLLSLNIKNCKSLTECSYSSSVETIDASGCTALESFYGSASSKLINLDMSGCTSLKELQFGISGNDLMLSNINLDGCTSLEVLTLEHTNIENFSPTGLVNLKTLTLHGNKYLTSIALKGCPALEEISLYDSDQLKSLDLENCASLNKLPSYFSFPSLTRLNLKDCCALSGTIDLTPCNLSELNAERCKALEGISCNYNQLTSLDVNGCIALKELACAGNQLEELEVQSCTALNRLLCSNNFIKTLDVSNMKALEKLYCYDNQLTELRITGCAKLNDLDCTQNALSQLDAKNCPLLDSIVCDYPEGIIR